MTRAPGPVAKPTGSFDAFALARTGGVLEGVSEIESLTRLVERLADAGGLLAWRIEGTRDRAGRPALAVAVQGSVALECQRCLEAFRYPVDQRTLTVLARNEVEADALDGSVDDEVLVADKPVTAADLVEDELLLTLPYVPRHPDGECGNGQE